MPPETNGLATKHHNNGLFSDHYLETAINPDDHWEIASQVKAIRDELRDLLATLQPQALNEAQLEEQWIRPVLTKLGHYFHVQFNIRARDSYLNPDYLFAATEADAKQLTAEVYSPADIRHCLAVGDAKAWGVNLDRGKSNASNPSVQIYNYLQFSELKWGILTDGRYWRLYERTTSRDNIYYAIDLQTLLEEGSADDFYYFYFFFRRTAFQQGGWLDTALSDSITYAEELSEQLEDEVYDALTLIAQGFLDYQRNWRRDAEPNLHEIYTQSLVLLYRMLFILYAESRNILPMKTNLAYRDERSFSALKREVATTIDFHPNELARRVEQGTYYEKLSTLFYNLDIGSSHYNITAYNGRLFSEDEYPFLADKRVGDPYMAHAIDKLSRVSVTRNKKDERVFVDYRDLDVRHLGAIYEKLLEYELDIAKTHLTVKGRKKPVYKETTDIDKAVVEKGKVYLRTGNHERKVTGSYYTPDYIVSFIVGQSIEPLLQDITQQHATRADDGTWQVHDAQALRQAILSINVLDPATGSGHFMVEVVNQIASWLNQLNLLPDDLDSDEEELTYWKRQVVSACVYGVDVNPLAVELAKLSLWLTTISSNSPLNFLDHHVRLGNTLVGARIDQLTPTTADTTNDGQLSLFDAESFTDRVSSAVSTMAHIESTVADNIEDVKQQEKEYAEVFAGFDRWRTLANVWTARHFGLKLDDTQWDALYQHTLDETPLPDDLQTIVDEATTLHHQYHFFHWEFAFPEVFFDPDGKRDPDAGFDAVVGNPPYVRQERIKPYKSYFEKQYEVYSGTADLFLYFYERGLSFIRPSQRVGYITSGTFMNSNSAKAFRQYIDNVASFDKVIDFGAVQPFKGADLATNAVIAILREGKHGETFRALNIRGRKAPKSLFEALKSEGIDTPTRATSYPEWRIQSKEMFSLADKILHTGTQLIEIAKDNIYRGIVTGLDDVFIIDKAKREALINTHKSSAEIIKPILRGEDLRPWYSKSREEYLIRSHVGINIEQYPAVLEYFKLHKTALAKRYEPAHGQCEWFELRPCVYYDEFDKPKIMYPGLAKFPRFYLDTEARYTNNSVYFMSLDDEKSSIIFPILQSRLIWFVLSQISTPRNIRDGLWRYVLYSQYIERLPIPDLTPAQERQLAEYAEAITGFAQKRYQTHEAFRHRVTADLGHTDGKLNTKMTDWWELSDFKEFQEELEKSFKDASIPVKQRTDWETYWKDETQKHTALTQDIIDREIKLNDVVYDAFNLTADERALIEKATKYPYGAV